MSPRTRTFLLVVLCALVISAVAASAWYTVAIGTAISSSSASARSASVSSLRDAVAPRDKAPKAPKPPKLSEEPSAPAEPPAPEEPPAPPAPDEPPAPPAPEEPPIVPEPGEPPAPPAAPGAMSAVACTAGDMQDHITFAPPADGAPTGFSLYVVASTAAAPSLVATAGADACSFTVPVTEAASRSYRVSATGPGGEGPLSGVVTNDLVAITREVTPSGATIRASNGEMSLALPPGSYAATTTVTVKEVAGSPRGRFITLAGVYELSPSGPLGAPATLSVAYTTSIEHFQVKEAVLASAKLMTYDAANGAWVDGATNLTANGGSISGTLSHFSYWTGATVQPHGTSSTAYCSTGPDTAGGFCHDLSTYPDSATRIAARDSQVCYNCHGSAEYWSGTEPPVGAYPDSPNIEYLIKECSYAHPVDSGLFCVSCHDPHADPATSPGLLKAKDAVTGTYVTGGEAFCWTCHGAVINKLVNYYRPGYFLASGGDKKTGYVTSAHFGRVPASPAGSCTGCHSGHGGDSPAMLVASEEETCFACHTASPTVPSDPAPDVMSPLVRDGADGQAGHPIEDPASVGLHSSDEAAENLAYPNRHVECADCHDSHRAKQGVHVIGTNEAPPALDGVWGVRVTNGVAGSTPTYTRTEDVSYEYELCFKCHSAYVPGYATTYDGWQSKEDLSVTFNPANASAHPIEAVGKNLGIKDSAFVQGTPWNPTDGDDPDYGEDLANLDSIPKMTCSDCHSSNDLSEARGPHGSTFDNLLAKTASATHLGPYTGLYYGENDLCYTCHAASVYDKNASAVGRTYSRLSHGHFTAKTHCLGCHDPHGSSREHMLYPAISLNHTAIGGRLNLQNVPVVSGVACNWTGCHAGWVDYTSNY